MNIGPDIQAWRAALEAGDTEAVRMQIANGIEVDAPLVGERATPLMLAVSRGQEAVARILLMAGADANLARPDTGITPLVAAVHGAREEVIRLLCQHGAEVDLLDQDGLSPLGIAVGSQHHDIAKALLQCNANPNIVSVYMKPPIVQAAANGDIPMVKLLLEGGARLDNPPSRDSALIEASDAGHVEMVRFLLDRNMRVDQQDGNGNTPLMLASTMGHAKVVELLLARGANPNCTDKKGLTAFHRAFDLRNPETDTIALSLLANMRVDQAAHNGETPVFAAIEGGNHRVVQHLIDMGADLRHANKKLSTVMHAVARHGDPALAKLLLDHGAPRNNSDYKGRTALHVAAEEDKIDMAMLLASHCNINAPNSWGQPAIMSAAGAGNDGVALMLMERGADLEMRAIEGSLQHCAAMGGATGLLKVLIARQSVDETYNASGRQPLHEAAAHNQAQAGAMLVLAGADLERPTRDGRRLEEFASREFMHLVGTALAVRQAGVLQDNTAVAGALAGRRRI